MIESPENRSKPSPKPQKMSISINEPEHTNPAQHKLIKHQGHRKPKTIAEKTCEEKIHQREPDHNKLPTKG